MLFEGENQDEDEIRDYFSGHFQGNWLLSVGDELIKNHYHTNEPWKVPDQFIKPFDVFVSG